MTTKWIIAGITPNSIFDACFSVDSTPSRGSILDIYLRSPNISNKADSQFWFLDKLLRQKGKWVKPAGHLSLGFIQATEFICKSQNLPQFTYFVDVFELSFVLDVVPES